LRGGDRRARALHGRLRRRVLRPAYPCRQRRARQSRRGLPSPLRSWARGRTVIAGEACLRLFDRALADCGIPREPAARLSTYFREATEAMRAYGASAALVPDRLPLRMA